MRRKRLSYAILGGLLLFVAGCAPAATPPVAPPAGAPSPAAKETPKPGPAKMQRVRLATAASKGSSSATPFIGKEKGVFMEEGIDLDLLPIQSAMGTAATISGEMDYNGTTTTTFVAAVRGAPIKVLMAFTNAGIWSLIGGPGINTAQDIKGKGVAVPSRGGGADYAAGKGLNKLGLDPDKDITFIVVSGSAQLAALRAGSVSVATMSPPVSIQAKDDGYKVLINTWEVVNFPGNGLAARESKLKESPDQVKRMIRATLKSMAYMRDHPQETIDYFVKEFELDKKMATASYEHVMNITTFDGNITDEGGRQLADLARAGGVTASIDPQKHIDLSFLKAAQKELGITR